MVAKIAGVLTAVYLLPACLFGQAAPDNPGAAGDSYWIVDSKDAISYRSQPGEEHVLKGHYTPLRPSDEVFCTVEVPPPPPAPPPPPPSKSKRKPTVAPPPPPPPPTCTLMYLTADSTGILTDQLPANRWVSLTSIPDIPKPSPMVRSSRDLLEEMGKKARRGGLSKGSGCSGNLPVMVPVCGETIDPGDFAIEWTDPPDGGNYATLFVNTIDELHSQSLRLDRIPLSAHRYDNARLREFLQGVQKDSAPTNIVLRLSQSQENESSRIVTIPSRIDQKGLHEAIEMVQGQQDLIRDMSLISIYVDFGLWSKAGQQARQLLTLAPDEDLVMTYALIGFCQSGYTREAAELRTRLNRLGITDVCPEGQK
jgi:hypothetical protein